jgi:hypothetical protein
VDDGLLRLARIMSDDAVTSRYWQFFDLAVVEKPQYRKTAKAILDALKKMKVELDLPELAISHMDEVLVVRLGRDQIPYCIALGKICREFAPELRIFMSVHTMPGSEGIKKLQAIDPYVDIRCYHGHWLDQWLGSGHTFEEFQQELKTSGDEAWVYFNPIGTQVTPKWMRIINGPWLWMSPVTVHCPWTYNEYWGGDPLDDTDGHDHGFAFPVDGQIVTTRLWEAFREGVDDMRYIKTLEQRIQQRRSDPKYAALCSDSEMWLKELRSTLLSLPLKREQSAVVKAIAGRYGQQDFDHWRLQCAEWIERLGN